jgi:hypothetical protein
VWGEGNYLKNQKNWKICKNQKKLIYLFLFSIVTIYRLYHTHSLGSVEPTIALSESLWSRIVTLIKRKKMKRKKKKYCIYVYMYLFVLFVCLFSFYIVTVYRLDHTYSSGSVEPTIALSKSLWSRIVTFKKSKKLENRKFQKNICFCFCVCCIVYVSVMFSNTDDEIELNCLRWKHV